MDTYTKGVLTVIAIALVSISFQLSDTKRIKTAHSTPTKTLEERVTTLEVSHFSRCIFPLASWRLNL